MLDPFGRAITYLRVSVTDRCDLRCVYCMAEEMNFLPKAEVLTLEELDRLAGAFVRLGTRKMRLTGGEPLVRRDVMRPGRAARRADLADRRALDELTLTTNGTQLARFAAGLARGGRAADQRLARHARPGLFTQLTRGGKIAPMLDGIDAAKAAGLAVKINAVALKDVNEDEIRRPDRLVRHSSGLDLCLIETMPMGEIERGPHRPVPAAVAGPLPPAPALDPGRDRLPHRRAGALLHGARDRAAHRLHHADDAQFLRELQPRAADLHRHAVSCASARTTRPICARCCAPAPTTRRWRRRSARRSRASPRAMTSSSTGGMSAPSVGRHMSLTGG